MLALPTGTENAAPVSFAEYQSQIPPILRLALAMLVTVGLAVLFVHLFHRHILKVNAAPPKNEDDSAPDPPPGVKDIGGRLIALTTFAFVFLLGFGFSQFWGTAKDARDAVLNEGIDYQRVVGAAQQLPPDQSAPILAALEDYRASVIDVEWPLMEVADTDALAAARYKADAALTLALYQGISSADSKDNLVWSKVTDSTDDLLSDAIDRTNALPSPMAVSLIALVSILGILNLIAIALFQPTGKKANLAIVGMMAALTAFLMFAIVEISNPYTGAGAVTSELLQR